MSTIYGPESDSAEPLRPVSDLAGLPVQDVQGRPTGDVFGALAEATSGLVRYLDIALFHGDRHVLVPVGHVRVDREDGRARVRLRAATREELEEVPAFDAEVHEVDGAYQRRLLDAHGRLFYGERYYAHPAFEHSGLYAGEHPIIRGPTDGRTRGRRRDGLAPLSSLYGMDVASGEPDIRGWSLVAGDDRRVGAVADLIVDPAERKVRYVLVRLDDSDDRLRMLPVGFLRIEERDRRVRAPALNAPDVAALPDAPERPDRAFERSVRAVLEQRLDGSRRFHRPDFRYTPRA